MKKAGYKTLAQSLLVSAISLATINSANAATGTFAVGFTTVADVTITEVQPLSFGTTMFITNGGICTLDALTPLAATMQSDETTLTGTNFGNVAGSGCVTTAAGASGNQGGYYRLTGLSGANVKITVNPASNADFGFVPSGCVNDHDGTAVANSDNCLVFTSGTQLTATLANAVEGGGANPVDTQLMLAVGGTITIGGTDLTSATVYTQNFTIVATY
jgi:hypothetical protein